jgi:predicted lipoprotein with Yx(FWY)xxD motif
MRKAGVALALALALGSVAVVSALAFGRSSDRGGARSLVKLRKTRLGRVLVDARGRTLYLFEPDEFGRSVCYGACARAWPPLVTSGTPRARAGARAALLATAKRRDGRMQVTYAGYPLYSFVRDSRPGQTLGQGLDGFGGEWYVLDGRGRKIEDGRHGGDPAVVRTRKTALGTVLVDGRGRTLYLFEADKGTRSACYGPCAAAWPPLLTTGKPQAAGAARAALLGTSRRKNGKIQITYRGHPLYYFVRDGQAGQEAGEGLDGFGGEWYLLDRAGREVERQRPATTTTGTTATTPSTTTTGGGYGGGHGYGG